MKLTLDIAKKVGDSLGVDWDKITPEKWLDAMNVEMEHKDVLKNPDNPNEEDFKLIGKITFAHLKESYKYYDMLEKMEKNMKNVNENINLTKSLSKTIGDKVGVNWKKIPEDKFFKIMKHEESEMKYMNNDDLGMEDYVKIGKIAKSHFNESVLRKAVGKIIKETFSDRDSYHKLKYEFNKSDTAFELAYNQTLGEYGVDSPDQLDDSQKDNFYDSLDSRLKGDVKPITEFNYEKFAEMLSEGKIQKGKIFREHGVFLTFQELALMEVAPPGREDQVKKLKDKFPKDVVYKIAWSQANKHGKPKNENTDTVLMPPDFETEKKVKNEEEVVQPDTKGKKLVKEKEKEKEEDEKNEIAFSAGIAADRYDKSPQGTNNVATIPGQQSRGSSEYGTGIRSKPNKK